MFKNVIALSAVLALTGSLMASPVYIDDTFDDNDPGTNTNGVGGDYHDAIWKGSISEAAGELVIYGGASNDNGGLINQNTQVPVLSTEGVAAKVTLGKADVEDEGGSITSLLGLINNNIDDPDSGLITYWNDGGGVLVQTKFSRPSGNSSTNLEVSGSIVVMNQHKEGGGDGGNVVTLADFSVSNYDGQSWMDVMLSMNQDGMTVQFSEDVTFSPIVTGFSGSGSTGSISWADVATYGSFADPGFDLNLIFDENGEGTNVGLGINGGEGTIRHDSLLVVPEPATMALLGIGGLGALLRRRR